MIVLLFANRLVDTRDIDPGAVWFAACMELLVEALVASILVGLLAFNG